MQYLVALVLAAAARPQDGAPDLLDRAILLLRSDDIRVREAGERRLSRLPPADVPLLSRRARAESDIEVRSRLTGAARSIVDRESSRLLAEGRVEESLRVLATAEDDQDVEGCVLRLKKEAEAELRASFPETSCIDECCGDFPRIAEEIREIFGAWGTAVLLDCLEQQDVGIPAVRILREREDVLPCLLRALDHGSVALRDECCAVLYARVFVDGKPLRGSAGLRRSLQILADDPAADPGTRQKSRDLLEALPQEQDADPLP
jgi:hypothetical protein